MDYDDLFIRCYQNSSQHFQVSIAAAGVIPEGGAVKQLSITPAAIESARQEYTAIIDQMRRMMLGYSVARPRIEKLQDLQRQLLAHAPGQRIEDFQALRDTCEQLVKTWDMPRGDLPLVGPVDYARLLGLSRQLVAMFPGSSIGVLRQALRRARAASPPRGLRVVVDVAPNARQLLDLPWEILAPPVGPDDDRAGPAPLADQFLFLNPDVSFVRQVANTGAYQPFVTDPALPMQAFVAQSRLGIRVNTEEFWRELAPANEDKPAEQWWSTDPDTLRSIYERLVAHNPQIVQLICHGKLSPSLRLGLERCDLLVTYVDEAETVVQRVSSYDLVPLLRLAPNLQLVILTVCDSSGAQNSAAEHSIVSNLAYELVRVGIPTVIGMQGKIAQKAAAQFSGALYRSLKRGSPLDQAVSEARIAIASRWPVDWSMPVVYRGSDTREQPAWHTRLADRIELFLFDPAVRRGARAKFIALMIVLLVGSAARWLLLPGAAAIDAGAIWAASVFWAVCGALCPLLAVALMRPAGPPAADRAERTVIRHAQIGGALLGYVLGGAAGLMVLTGVFGVLGASLPGAAWLAGLLALVGGSLALGYAIARSQVRGARANWRLYPDTYGWKSWAWVGGAMALTAALLPAALASATGRGLLEALLLRPGLAGVAAAALSLAMLVSVERG